MTNISASWLAAVPFALIVGCGNSDPLPSGAGGSVGVGGTTGVGGQSKGGTSATTTSAGGTTTSTSTASSGGATATSNKSGTGGTTASGGSEVAAGGTNTSGTKTSTGTKAVGGTTAAGGTGTQSTRTSTPDAGGSSSVSRGGTVGKGGASSPGGANPTGGTKSSSSSTTAPGGASTGGSTSAGGGTSSGSPGCGNASPLKSGTFTESIDGTSRKWMLDVPSNYDASKPYRLIFVWHPLGGSGSAIVSGGFNGLKSQSNNTTIFATADGLNGSNGEASGNGWWNKGGGDMKLVQVMLDKINAGLCIDRSRIFSTGFSFGGMMSYTLPFEFNVFRAVAPCSGKTGVIDYQSKFDGPVPIMAFHGDKDTFVQTALGKEFLDRYRTRNHCGNETKPVDPSPCVQYQGCDVPTIWCVFSGAHEVWGQESAAIWKFFSQF